MDYNAIDEIRHEIYERDDYTCQYPGCGICGADNIELAHRISKGKTGRRDIQRYLRETYKLDLTIQETLERYIHNPHNIATSCRKHNDNFNCLYNPVQAKEIIDKIYLEE